MTDWPLEIDGHEYAPIPESWLDWGNDEDYGSPRVYAVSVARSTRDLIRIRYVARDGGVYVQSTNSAPNPTGEGVVPASLAKVRDWPRSIVPPSHVEPVDTARDAERERLVDVWSERADDLEAGDAGDGRRLVADGGVRRSAWTPADLDLADDVPEWFREVDVPNDELRIDVERDLQQYQRQENIAPKDPFIELTQSGVRAAIGRIADRTAESTGVEGFEHVSPHDLRRRFAQRLLVDENMNPRVVMTVGGWDSFDAIEPYLNEPTPDVVDDAFAEVEIV